MDFLLTTARCEALKLLVSALTGDAVRLCASGLISCQVNRAAGEVA
jgi:hypothetical protein